MGAPVGALKILNVLIQNSSWVQRNGKEAWVCSENLTFSAFNICSSLGPRRRDGLLDLASDLTDHGPHSLKEEPGLYQSLHMLKSCMMLVPKLIVF